MLAEKYLELLTAYVDGELSARRQRMVHKLLRKSPEARDLLKKLQRDSNDLIDLRSPQAPDVSHSVVHIIAERGLKPRRSSVRPGTAIPLWRGVAAAAAVLLLAAGGSFWFFKGVGENGRGGHMAQHRKNTPALKPLDGDRKVTLAEDGFAKKTTADRQPVQPRDRVKDTDKGPDKDRGSEVVKVPDTKPEPDKTPEKPEPGTIYTSPGMGVFNPREAEVALPTLLRLRDLAQEKTQQTLVQELSRHDGFYIELLCREGTHALPRLQSVLQAGGFEFIVDGAVQQRLKQPSLKTNFLVYLDNVTAEELARLLQPLGQEDPKGDKKKPAFGQFASADANLIVCPMSADHRKKITAYLGTDPRQVKATGPLGVDLTRPLSEQTADRLAPAGSRPVAGKTADRSALALIHGTPRPQSVEVKRFLEGRKPARKGTLQVLLVLRGKP